MVAPTSIILDDALKGRVQHLAEVRRRSSHWIMREAIAQYVASPQGLFARQRFLGHKRNMGYATRFNRAIGSLSGWNSPAGSRLACSQR